MRDAAEDEGKWKGEKAHLRSEGFEIDGGIEDSQPLKPTLKH